MDAHRENIENAGQCSGQMIKLKVSKMTVVTVIKDVCKLQSAPSVTIAASFYADICLCQL